MGLFELIFQPINFFFLIPTIVLLLFLLNSFATTNASISSSFDNVCASENEQYLFSDYSVSSGDVFFQFVFPQDSSFDLMLEYNDKSLRILESLYDSSSNIRAVVLGTQGKLLTRQNFGLLRQCSDETCLCIADTGINNFDFSYINITACFSLLYAYGPSRIAFDDYTKNANASKGNYQIFSEAVSSARLSLNPTDDKAIKAINCYNYMDSLDLGAYLLKNEQFLYKEKVLSNNEIHAFLSEFYLNTQASLLYNIKDCSKIPNKDDCMHTSDVKSNYLVLPKDYVFRYEKESISAGASFSCRIFKTAVGATCWGGILGESGDMEIKSVPVFVSGNYNYSGISVGDSHACAVLSNKKGVCFGKNDYSQLGNGLTADSSVPVFVSGNYNFNSISSGSEHSCGVLSNGSAVCWGYGLFGRLGNGSESNSSVPVFVSGNYIFSSVSSGSYHSCGVLSNGSAVCWGNGETGQLGNRGYSNSLIPAFVYGNYNFSSISSGSEHSCGVLSNGSAVCWGSDWNGQLGNGNAVQQNTPVFVSGNYNFSSISSGSSHSCGIFSNGSAVCWGYNEYGQLGNGGASISLIPAFVKGDYRFSGISAGNYITCGILTNGSSLCWGMETNGMLGNGIMGGQSRIPVFVREIINEDSSLVFSRDNFNIFIAMNPDSDKTGLKSAVIKDENLLIISSLNAE
jgi:alpha-tubulin suppressor-like RCC1 family protein